MQTMMKHSLIKYASIALLAAMTISIVFFTFQALAFQDPLFWLNPPEVFIIVPPGDPEDMIMRLDDITNVYGLQVSLSFDPAIIEVVDADPGLPGVQILPGSCPQPDFIVVNDADNTLGTIDYAVTQLFPSPPCDGGDVATITFQCVVSDGTSPVSFTQSIISDPDGLPITHNTQDGMVTCMSPITPTPTDTSVPPSPTPTDTPLPPSPTPTNTIVLPTPTPTDTIEPPFPTPTDTPTPTPTLTDTAMPPTNTPTGTETPGPFLRVYMPIILNR